MNVLEEKLSVPIVGHYDVIVAGGGPAGVAAAVSAARQGTKVLLIENNGCLGGVWTSGILAWVFDVADNGIGKEITDELRKYDACVYASGGNMQNFSYDVETMKYVLEKMCVDAGIDVLLHTKVVAADVDEDKRLRHAVTESKSFRQAWSGDVFIDCTGDGDLGALAGNSFEMGGEAGELQPLTLMGILYVKDIEKIKHCVSFYGGEYNHPYNKFKKILHENGINVSYGHPTLFHLKGNLLALMVNHSYGVDATDAKEMSDATISARAEIYDVAAALSKTDTGFKGCVLASSAEYIGVREGRRLAGKYKVVYEDLINGKEHEDAVCKVRFNIDIHSSDPGQSKGLKTQQVPPYDIPMRALIAKDIDGLLMAGRCISGDRLAFSSYRVTGPAVSMGEAAGRFAAESISDRADRRSARK